MLKVTYDSESDIPEDVKHLYEKKGEKWVLQFEGQGRLAEFRDNNRNLKKQLDETKQALEKFKGVDPEKYQEAVQKLRDLEDEKLIKAGQLDEVLEKRTERMRADFDNQLNAYKTRSEKAEKMAEALKGKISEMTIETEIAKAVGDTGEVKKGALGVITLQAKQAWKVDDNGNMYATNSDGSKIYGENGDPLTIPEWTKSLKDSQPFLFEESTGSNSQGDGTGDSSLSSVDNPDGIMLR